MNTVVNIGNTVTLLDEKEQELYCYTLVESFVEITVCGMGGSYNSMAYRYSEKSDSDGETKISNKSKLGAAIIGRKVGDAVTFIDNDSTIQKYVITKIS